MDSRAPAVVAVIVTTGAGPGLDAAVASVVASDYEALSLLVVANGDAVNVAERVAAVAPDAFVRLLDENRGFGAACNEAALMVEGSAFFLFCHDDVRLEPDAVSLMVEAAYRTNAGIVTPKVVAYDDALVLLHVGQTSDRFGVVRERVELGEIDHGQQDLERDVFVAPGGVTLVRADLFATLRGFDPLITLIGEDLDLCWRAQVAGARIVVAPLAKVAHRETIATGERAVTAVGTRRASRQDLHRRHQLLVVATGWGWWASWWTLSMVFVLDVFEMVIALLGRDVDRAGAIVGSWRWIVKHRRRVRQRRREMRALRVLSDADLRRLQVGGASRVKQFFLTLLREGYDRARGILPDDDEDDVELPEEAGVGFAAAFAETEEFDDIAVLDQPARRARPSRVLTSFRSQATLVAVVVVLWFIGSRNLFATPLPLIGRLAPLDSWWSTWRHFFASWSPNGVGTGTPGMPGYGVLAFAGTFVVGRMGVLPRLALIACVPVGAIGVGRLLKSRVSNRARLAGVLAYTAMPLGLNMISQGRVDVLVVVAGLPFVVRRLFELLNVPGFRTGPYAEPVPFGHRGWRVTEAGQRMVLFMLVALLCALAPATIVAVALVIAGVVLARYFDPDEGRAHRHSWRLLGAVVANVAIFLLPLSVDVVLAGRRFLEVLGVPRGPWSVPTFSQLLRDVDGTFGATWWGWLLPVAAVFSLLLCRGERRRVATKVASIATLTLVVECVTARHWLGSFSPDLDVLLALYGVMIATLIGLGVGALELDLRDARFGWRQLVAGLALVTMVLAALPLIASVGSGRFDLPTSSVAESLSALAPTSAGGFRVLWLGDPSVLPLGGWTVAPGLEAATSMNGLPGGATLFTPPDSGTTDVVLEAVKSALAGSTVQLGQLLAPAGISTIVVMNAAAPELAGVQSVPLHPAPAALVQALDDQNDLSLELRTASASVYSNAQFHGITSSTSSGEAPMPVFDSGSFAGPLSSGTVVQAGLAPAGAFALDVNGSPTPRSTHDTWTPFYTVPTSTTTLTGTITLHQFPWNGILALFTLGMWSIVWLGFGWIHRLEWLFTGRRPRRRPRDVEGESRG